MPFPAPGKLFSTYFAGWNRLEARSRRDDFARGLTAATADGLWMLARQLQMQELKGIDAGTPIHARIDYRLARMASIKLGDEPYRGLGNIPIEVRVEREAVDWDWRMRVRVGQHFERLARRNPRRLSEEGITDIRTNHCPLTKPAPTSNDWIVMDFATRRFVAMMAGRAIDGRELMNKLRLNQLNAVITDSTLRQDMLDWYGDLYSQGTGRMPPAWKPERLDYQFELRSSPFPAAPIKADSYRNGTIDWVTFSQTTPVTTVFREECPEQLTPAHATFAGQPMRRWWAFEDHAVNFGDLDVAKTDLGKLVLMEFALVFGDDWFVVPLNVPPNSLVAIQELKVRDCFGVEIPIARARNTSSDPLGQWEVFGLGPSVRGGQVPGILYVPPITGVREESPVLEEVRFARDEDANVVFAIENTVPNQLGEPVNGYAAHLEAQRRWREHTGTATSATDSSGMADSSVTTAEASGAGVPLPKIKFVLATRVPRNWIPFIATDKNAVDGIPSRSVKLQRGHIVSTEPEDAQQTIAALSRLLNPSGGAGVDWINEEAVGRAGVRVELRRQRMRTEDGRTYVWLGRKVGMGKGEARSGLRYDVVVTNER